MRTHHGSSPAKYFDSLNISEHLTAAFFIGGSSVLLQPYTTEEATSQLQ